jgi:LPXTG-motif cell wall-anchored protein
VRLILVGSILLSTALPSHAVTLGRHGGAAVIGRPLDIRVEALAGPNEDLSAACIRSEVFFGETKLSSSAVQLTPQRTAPDAKASIRVQTTVPVNEPVVSVMVYAGCDASFSRRYVLLADLAVEEGLKSSVASVGAVRDLGGANGVATAMPRLATTGSLAIAAANSRNNARAGNNSDAEEVVRAPKVASKPVRKAPATKAAPTSVVRKPVVETAAAGPKLHLDPVDMALGIERDPVLKLSLSMLSEPTTSEQERAAAGLLWKAINASPEDVLRDTQKLAVLEAESKGLREQEANDKAAIKAMQAQLDQTRYITWLAYLMGALLLLSLLGLWFFRRRKEESEVTKEAGAWWDAAKKPGAGAVASAAGLGAVAARRDPSGGVDIDLDLDGESGFDEYESLHDSSLHGALMPSASAALRDQQLIGSRSVATEELFDIQQQSDFFVSLGETDKAIECLKNHLVESQEPSALAYLDLFKLYHQQGNRADYDTLREEFNHKFNAGAPPFDQYSDNSVGLEGYEAAFSRIQALWPQPRVLDVIERSIFRDPDDENGEVFDLEAYRELLLLHAVAKEMIHETSTDAVQVDFEHTSIKPLKAATSMFIAPIAGGNGPSTEPFENMPMASPRLGLDVDLDALSEMSAFEASLPEVPSVVEATAVNNERLSRSVAEEGNLIDFEVMDFMPPDDIETDPKKGR